MEAPGPRIERGVADQLAELSDELAGSLETGDSCAASQTAARLRDSVTQAINDGKVPEVYLEDLSGLANELQAQVPECVAPPPPPVEDDGDDEKKKKKKKKKKEDKDKGKDKEKDRDDGDEAETENIPTEPDLIPTETETTEPTTTGSEEER